MGTKGLERGEASRFGRAHSALAATLALAVALPFLGCNFEYDKSGGGNRSQAITESPGFEDVRALVFEPHCLGCHSTRAPILGSYEQVVANLDAIEDAVLRDTPRSARRKMPPKGPIAPELRKLLADWIKNGAPREGGDPDPNPSPTVSPTPTPAGSIPRPFTYAHLKERVLESKCLLCHATGNPDDLTPLDTYKDMRSVASFVEPLVIGVKNEQTVPPDQRMPPKAATQLTAEEKAFFLLWLHDGMIEK